MTTSRIYRTEPHTPAQYAVAKHLALLTSGQIEEWGGLYASDAVFAFPFAPAGMSAELRGRDVLKAHMRNVNATFDVRAIDLRFVDTDDSHVAVALWTLDGTAVPTGRPFTQECFGVVQTDAEGLIARYDDYWNPLKAIDALQPVDSGVDGSSGIAGAFGA